MSDAPPMSGSVLYSERVSASWVLWVVALVFAASLGLAYGVRVSAVAGLAAVTISAALSAVALSMSAVRITVADDGLHAGGAHLPAWACGPATALDGHASSLLRGADADPRAWMVLRGWVPTAVRIDVADPADATPYWYVSSRHPEALAAAVQRAAEAADRSA